MKVELSPLLALILITRGGRCESFTTGIGSCLRPGSGKSLVGLFGSDSACAPCIAHLALNDEGES